MNSILQIHSLVKGNFSSASCSWTATSFLYGNPIASVPLGSILLTKPTQIFTSSSLAIGTDFPIALTVKSPLIPGYYYIFRLTMTAREASLFMHDEVTVQIRIPPFESPPIESPPIGANTTAVSPDGFTCTDPPSLTGSPSVGYALQTKFSLSTVFCQHTSTSTLHFNFGYSNSNGKAVIPLGVSYVDSTVSDWFVGLYASSSMTTLLPTGSPSYERLVFIYVTVTDNFGATTTLETQVTVLPSAAVTTATLLGLINTKTVQNVGLAVSSISTNTTLLSSIGSSCTSNDNCASNACSESICSQLNESSISKICPTSVPGVDCSGNGVCSFYSTNGAAVHNCLATNSSCIAACLCRSGYQGRGCHLTTQEFDQQDSVLRSACAFLGGVPSNESIQALSALSVVHQFYMTALTTLTCFEAFVNVSSNIQFISDPTSAATVANLVSSFVENTFITTLTNSMEVISTANISNTIDVLTSNLLNAQVVGQDTKISTSSFNISVFSSYWEDLFNASLTSGNSSVQLPSTGLDSCGRRTAYATFSLVEWGLNLYRSPSTITPIFRWTYPKNLNKLAFNSTFYLELPYLSTLSLPSNTSSSNSSYPVCQESNPQTDSFSPCDCSLISYTNNSALFKCNIKLLCPSSVQFSFTGPQSNGAYTITELSALMKSSAVDVVYVLSTEYRGSNNTTRAKAVIAVVVCWIIFLFGGVTYFSFWDQKDSLELLKGPLKIEIGDGDCVDNAFQGGNLVSFGCASGIAHQRKGVNLIVGGNVILRFLRALQSSHPYLWFFAYPSLKKTRVIRFLSTCKAILLTIFISTVFFDIYFPNSTICSVHTTASSCLQVPSKILSGHSECSWDAVSRSCSVVPPPTSASFKITVSVLTTIVFSPFDLIFYLILNVVCSRKPNLGEWPFLVALGFPNPHDDSRELSGSPPVLPDVGKEFDDIITEIESCFNYFCDRWKRDDGDISKGQILKMTRKADDMGLSLNPESGVSPNIPSSYRGYDVKKCITIHVQRSRRIARRILENMDRLSDDDSK